MKKILFLLLCSVSFVATAQDMITTKKGEDIQAKVLEITINEIKYKRNDNPNSPIYTILKSDVLMIRYENGSKDIFTEEEKVTKKEVDDTPPNRITVVERHYFLNGERISKGEMKSILYKDPEARELYSRSEGLRTASTIFSVVSCVCSSVSIVMSLSQLANANSKSANEKYDENEAWYPLIAGGTFLIPAIIFNSQSNKVKARAIEAYNRHQDKKVTISPIIGTNNVGVVVRF